MPRNFWSFMPHKAKAKQTYKCALCGKDIPRNTQYVNWPAERARYHVACFEKDNPDMLTRKPTTK